MTEDRLLLAIQKSGRLSEESLRLLGECGISLNLTGSRSGKLRVRAGSFPLDVLFLRDDDIPSCVADGVADLGIVGQNVLEEKGLPVTTVEELGFARCRLSLALPKEERYTSISYFEGKKIATSYPQLVGRFLEAKGVSAAIHEISGSVEIAPSLGLADAICDLVSSGSTLLSNGLVEVETVLESEAVLTARPELVEPLASANPSLEQKRQLLSRLQFRLQSVRRAKRFKYIVLNAPNTALDSVAGILPGIKSPTIFPLADGDWSAVHSVIEESSFWEVIEQLKEAGAQGILVVPIEKMVD